VVHGDAPAKSGLRALLEARVGARVVIPGQAIRMKLATKSTKTTKKRKDLMF